MSTMQSRCVKTLLAYLDALAVMYAVDPLRVALAVVGAIKRRKAI